MDKAEQWNPRREGGRRIHHGQAADVRGLPQTCILYNVVGKCIINVYKVFYRVIK